MQCNNLLFCLLIHFWSLWGISHANNSPISFFISANFQNKWPPDLKTFPLRPLGIFKRLCSFLKAEEAAYYVNMKLKRICQKNQINHLTIKPRGRSGHGHPNKWMYFILYCDFLWKIARFFIFPGKNQWLYGRISTNQV